MESAIPTITKIKAKAKPSEQNTAALPLKSTTKTKTSETMITYKAIMERLALIAGVELSSTGSGRQVIDNAQNIEASSLIAVVGIIAIISISSIAVLLVVKKIKNN